VSGNLERLVAVVLTVSDLDRAVRLYGDGFGLDFHFGDHQGDEPWISGRHAATSWSDGAFMHFALYETKDGAPTTGAQIAFRVADIETAHQRALDVGVEVLHGPKPQPWGTSARYRDDDGNIIELTQPPTSR
jgi:predicted enzyme related to lactoylglutathione lyase